MDTSGYGLLQCLQKLSDEEFQRFKELLRKEPEKFKLKPISWTKIENTSKEDLVMQLNTRYPGKAWDMVVSLFLQVSREDLSAMAHKERRYKQTKYKEFMKNTFQHIWTLETKTHIPDGCYDIIIEHQYRALHGIFDYESEPVTAVVSGCRGGKLSLAVLISNKLPESSETYDILSDPKRILFILDGFDYLKFDLQLRTNLCNDWRKRLPTQIVLSSLLQKIMLPECSLLLELGNSSISKIIPLLQYPREIIIPGFSEKIIKFYCMSFFKTHTGIEVFENLKSIEPLFTLCRSPYLCWMICSSLKWRDVAKRFGQTVAFVYTVFMLSAFKSTYARNPSKQNRARLKTLCTLTVEGMWKQVSVFDSGDLRRNVIGNSEKAEGLRMKFFQKQGNNVVFYHSTLQWYFATLFYFLKQDKDTHHPVIGSLPQLLGEIHAHKQNQWFQTRILLFGMATEQVASLLEPCFGFVSTKEVRQEIIRYIKSLSQEECNDKLVHPWNLFFCILDNQEERFVRQVMDRFEEITVDISDVDDLSATQYSLQCAPKLKNLHLHIQKSIFQKSMTQNMVT